MVYLKVAYDEINYWLISRVQNILFVQVSSLYKMCQKLKTLIVRLLTSPSARYLAWTRPWNITRSTL